MRHLRLRVMDDNGGQVMSSARTEHSVLSETAPIWVLIDERVLTRLSLERLLKTVAGKFKLMAVANSTDLFDDDGHPRSGIQLVIYRIGAPSVTDPAIRAVIASLIERLPETPLVLLCERDDPEEVSQALAYGVRGYITTSLDPDLVMGALKLVQAGGTFVPPDTMKWVVSRASVGEPAGDRDDSDNEHDHPVVDRLTSREAAVMREMAKGISNKVIARALGIQESTVKVHVRQVMKKLKASNRTQVALLARQWCAGSSSEHDDSGRQAGQPLSLRAGAR